MKKNTAIITGLFMLMILAFTIDPSFIYNFENNLLGKAVIVLVLIYLTMNSVTLGLLFALTIILISNKSMIEGMKNKNKKVKKPIKNLRNFNNKNIKGGRNTNNTGTGRCKTLQELLREERKKKMLEKARSKYNIQDNNIVTPDTTDTADVNQYTSENDTTNATDNTTGGVDRLSVEETFRVRNPSTIPVTKEAFSVRNLNPFDNVGKYYGGACSLI